MARLAPRPLAAAAVTLALAAPAGAHPGAPHGPAPDVLASVRGGTAVALRECHLTAVFVPRPAAVLRPVFERPLDLSRTFYGSDPLLGVWALACERGRVDGRRVGRIRTALVGVPHDLTTPGAPPLANHFAHALVRLDTTSPPLAAAARRAGIPARVARGIAYRHSAVGKVPFAGRMWVPGGFRLAVRASELDPTNPHDHANRFDHRGAGRRAGSLGMAIQDAVDRFCFPGSGPCGASIKAPRRSALARLLGRRPVPVRAGFDHERVPRIDLLLKRRR
jgi:hypothetical protein